MLFPEIKVFWPVEQYKLREILQYLKLQYMVGVIFHLQAKGTDG